MVVCTVQTQRSVCVFWGEGSVYSMETCVVLVVCRYMSDVSGGSGFGTQLNVKKGVVGT